MRIVAGQYRRRKLRTNAGLATRPITDRVKEQFFENLGGELNGERVADVFAGTGTIGLEALSRGASSVVFFERDVRAAELLKENIEMLGVVDSTLCWRVDVKRTSFRPKNRDEMFPYDMIFFDPPYRLCNSIEAGSPLFKSLARLARSDVSSENAQLFFRTPSDQKLKLPPAWEPDWQLELSSMTIHTFRCVADNSADPTETP